MATDADLYGVAYSKAVRSMLPTSAIDLNFGYCREIERIQRFYSGVSSPCLSTLPRLADEAASFARAYGRIVADSVSTGRAFARLSNQIKDSVKSTMLREKYFCGQMKYCVESAMTAQARLSDQTKGLAESAAKAMESVRRDIASFASVAAALKDIPRVNTDLLRPFVSQGELLKPFEKLTTYAIDTGDISPILHTLSAFRRLEPSLASRDIRLNADRTVSVNGQVRSMTAVEDAVSQVVGSVLEERFTADLNDIKRRLEQIQPDPVLRTIVVSVVASILAWIICTFIAARPSAATKESMTLAPYPASFR